MSDECRVIFFVREDLLREEEEKGEEREKREEERKEVKVRWQFAPEIISLATQLVNVANLNIDRSVIEKLNDAFEKRDIESFMEHLTEISGKLREVDNPSDEAIDLAIRMLIFLAKMLN
jgi:hypothetical protein